MNARRSPDGDDRGEPACFRVDSVRILPLATSTSTISVVGRVRRDRFLLGEGERSDREESQSQQFAHDAGS